jgi:hypothetical protein
MCVVSCAQYFKNFVIKVKDEIKDYNSSPIGQKWHKNII